MRVIVDPALCEGSAVCQRLVPDIFQVGDDDKARVLLAHPDGRLRPKVELAAERCPRQAIRLVDDWARRGLHTGWQPADRECRCER
jgi:ferredoxin